MMSFFKRKNPYAQPAKAVYAQILDAAREPEFYSDYSVPDTFDGRFDLLLLHVFCVLNRMLEQGEEAAEAFNQALFDVTFADMDQTLREMGIGDMGVPKHQRRMMKGFNGRMHAYQQALADDSLDQALRKNLYGTVKDLDDTTLKNMVDKTQEIMSALSAQNIEEIMTGNIYFDRPKDTRKSA